MPTRKEPSLSVLTMVIIIILTATIVVTLTGFGIFGNNNAQGQENLTEEQKAAMCDPNNPKLNFVNGTESRICGIPKTIKNATSTAANATISPENTTAEGIAPPSVSSIAPSANTTTGGEEEQQAPPSEGSIAPQILP